MSLLLNKYGFPFRIILGALFCASAISKFSSVEGFDLYLFSFGFFSFDLCSLLARVIVIFELVLGIGLVSGLLRRLVNWSVAAMLLVFSGFLFWRALIGDMDSCHCFGDLVEMNPLQSLIKNAVFGLLLALGWRSGLECRALVGWIAAATVALAASVTVFAVSPASFWYRSKGSGQTLSEELWAPVAQEHGLDKGRQAVLFLSPLCEYCQHCAAKVSSMVSRHGSDSSRIHIVFLVIAANPEENPLLVPYFWEKAGTADPGFDTMHLSPDVFLPMTAGEMPLVCLFEDGVLVAEYGYNTLDEKVFTSHLAPSPKSDSLNSSM